MRLRAPESDNGGGGGNNATTTAADTAASTATDTKVGAQSMLDLADKAETKAAGTDTKVETKADVKAPVLVDEKWEPPAIDGVTRDTKVLGEARELFKKHGLTTAQAQALVEFSDAQAKASTAAVETMAKEADAGWVKELEGDKEIGGQKLPATRESVRTLLRSLKSGPAFSKWVDGMGIGNAAPVVRLLAELARRTGEDSVTSTVVDPAASSQNEHERRVAKTYGNSTRKES